MRCANCSRRSARLRSHRPRRRPGGWAVEAVAMAGGFELMQGLDIALVGEEPGCRQPHQVRVDPGGGGTQRMAVSSAAGRRSVCCYRATGSPARTRCVSAWHIAVFPQPEFDDGVRRFAADLATRRREAVTFGRAAGVPPASRLRCPQDWKSKSIPWWTYLRTRRQNGVYAFGGEE